MTDLPKIYFWHDRAVDDMTRDEILAVVKDCIDLLKESDTRNHAQSVMIADLFKIQAREKAACNGP